MLFKAFIESQFNYCSLIWKLHSRTMNNKINRLHERSLRIVYSDQSSTFEELLEREKTFSIHHKNIQSIAVEIYKFVNGLSPEIMNTVFNSKENSRYSLRNVYELYSRNPKTVKIRYRKNVVFSAKNMVYSTTHHKRKHFFIFLQSKNKEMETRLPMSALQKIFPACWFCIKLNFISISYSNM